MDGARISRRALELKMKERDPLDDPEEDGLGRYWKILKGEIASKN
jgi:hypothetical protein